MKSHEGGLVVSCCGDAPDLDHHQQDCPGSGDHGFDCNDDDDNDDDDDDDGQHGGHWKRRPGDGAAQTH